MSNDARTTAGLGEDFPNGSVLSRGESVSPRSGTGTRVLPELLSPAGDWECVKAAVENGADAIYFGLERFNARMRAKNFTQADLPALMEFLHRRGVRGYITFNTLIFTDELESAHQFLRPGPWPKEFMSTTSYFFQKARPKTMAVEI